MLYVWFRVEPIDYKSIFGLQEMALKLSGENFFNGCTNVGYGVSR